MTSTTKTSSTATSTTEASTTEASTTEASTTEASTTKTFTTEELGYLASQRLGRLATMAPDGGLQNSPVSFHVNADGTVDIPGYRMGATRKFANVSGHPRVAFVVDDIVSLRPWVVRCLEIRGDAQALTDVDPPRPGFSREVIRIRPRRIISFGINGAQSGMAGRTVA